jgi:hypothetical protein
MRDDIGVELASSHEVRATAVRAFGEMLRDVDDGECRTDRVWRMWVVDESGKAVCSLRCASEET